jgi:hypothetical protein
MRSARKIDDEEDARRCLAAAARAGLTPRDWCSPRAFASNTSPSASFVRSWTPWRSAARMTCVAQRANPLHATETRSAQLSLNPTRGIDSGPIVS